MPVPEVVVPTVRAADGQPLPVVGVLCIGRSYAEHAHEMGARPTSAPLHFLKSPAAVLAAPGPIDLPYPPGTQELHHELELVVWLGAGGFNLSVDAARAAIWGYALGLDMTRRDLQARAKAAGHPWSAAKDFDGAAVCGPVTPVTSFGHPTSGLLTLHVDGVLRQRGDVADLLWPVPELVAALSRHRTLRAGELIYTGTPAGVGPVEPGQVMEGRFPGLPPLTVTVTPGPAHAPTPR